MQQQAATQNSELDRLDMNAEHVMPPELPTQDSVLEDFVGQLSRVQSKLVDTLRPSTFAAASGEGPQPSGASGSGSADQLATPTTAKRLGPIDWVKFGERLQNGGQRRD